MTLSLAAGLLLQIRGPQLHSHSVSHVSLVEARTSPHLPRVRNVVGEERAFRTRHFLASESMHSGLERSVDKRHRLDLQGEQL